eukprot:COSAG05_NODE_196_length_14546_cov_55.423548_1_plen_163_part_00
MSPDDVVAPVLLPSVAAPSIWLLLLGSVFALYGLWLLSRLSHYLALNKIPNQLPSTLISGNVWSLAALPKVRYAEKPDTQSLFATQANEALASGHGLFRFAFFRYIPFLNREWIVIADKELAKELLSQDSYGKFQKGGMYKLASPLIGSGILVAAHFYSTND